MQPGETRYVVPEISIITMCGTLREGASPCKATRNAADAYRVIHTAHKARTRSAVNRPSIAQDVQVILGVSYRRKPSIRQWAMQGANPCLSIYKGPMTNLAPARICRWCHGRSSQEGREYDRRQYDSDLPTNRSVPSPRAGLDYRRGCTQGINPPYSRPPKEAWKTAPCNKKRKDSETPSQGCVPACKFGSD